VSDLKLDVQRLIQLRDDLQRVISEFNDAEDFSGVVAEATGHDELAGEVHDFAGKWNKKRKQMAADVQALHDQLAAITDGFTKVDQGLAKALEQSANDTSGKPAHGAPATKGK
jgi:hypothetical protein